MGRRDKKVRPADRRSVLSTGDIMMLLDVSHDLIRRWCKSGSLKWWCYPGGKKIHVLRRDLQAFLDRIPGRPFGTI